MSDQTIDLDDALLKSLMVDGRKPFTLDECKTRIDPVYKSKKQYRKKLAAIVAQIDNLQAIMNAENRQGLLLVFQAMDAAGKDGTIRRVLSGVNPAGVQVYSFKKPSAEELDHGYLWRVIQRMPERGRIGVFNRSYYEEVLVVRVHPEILTDYQQLPLDKTEDIENTFQQRFKDIRNFESYATNNGFKVIKFFLNVSRDEQRNRLLARLDEPHKNWKFTFSDVDEREFWPDYMSTFEKCIKETASKEAPWAVIPADDKLNMRLIVADIVRRTLKDMDPQWPLADKRLATEIDDVRERLKRS